MMPRKTKTQRNGFVLIVVLCMIIMLAVILFGFNAESRRNLSVVDGSKKSAQALNCARAGLNITIATIRNTDAQPENKTLQNLLSEGKTFDIDNGTCSIAVFKESGKLNINFLKDKDGKLNRMRIDQLLRLIDLLNREFDNDSIISYDIVPSIIDWADHDDEVTYLPFIKNKNSGAESSYYSQLKKPYICRNGPFSTIQELLLVKGVTTQIFDRLRNYITVHGDEKIDINYASKHVIKSLSEEMDDSLTQMIVNQRQFKPFGNITELRDVPGMTDNIYNAIRKTVAVATINQYYYVRSRGTVDERNCTIFAMLRKNKQTKEIEVVIYKER